MDIFTEMRNYVRENPEFSVPRLQKKFGVSYKTAYAFLKLVENEKNAEYLGGTLFKYEDSEMRRRAYVMKQEQAIKRREEALYSESVWTCIKCGQASVSLLQRRIGLPLADAKNFIARMEREGHISPTDGVHCRKVFITKKRFKEVFGEPPDGDDEYDEDAVYEELKEFMQEQEQAKKSEIQKLATALRGVIAKKGEPVSSSRLPDSSLWTDRIKFCAEVKARLEKIVLSDGVQTRNEAVSRAEALLEGVRDTRDGAMVQVYERLVYDLKTLSDYRYKNLKKRLGKK